MVVRDPSSQSASYLDEVTPTSLRAARVQLAGKVRRTPVVDWPAEDAQRLVGPGTELRVKLEILQHAGCFKVRGALLTLLHLSSEERKRGVIAASAGNHAVSLAFAARAVGVSAVVVVPRTASPARLELCRYFGAEVALADDIHSAFEQMEERRAREGRTLVHSYDNPWMVLGAATLAAEMFDQVTELDALVVSVGGGGLCAGTAAAARFIEPRCAVYGVEPEGADTMCRSLESGRPERLEHVRTIADSLAAPGAADRTFTLCREYARAVVRVSDDEIREAGRRLFRSMKLAVEPAAAAAVAAVLGPLKQELRGNRVGVVLCGSNLTETEFAAYVGNDDAKAEQEKVQE